MPNPFYPEPEFNQLFFDILNAIGIEGMAFAGPKIPSDQLRAALVLQINEEFATAKLHVPHYWAVYYHDGRGPFGPRLSPILGRRKARFLVWFRDPLNDPRLNSGQYPVRFADTRQLSAQQFLYWLQRNKEAVRNGGTPPMIVLRDSNYRPLRHPGNPPQPFFSNDADGGMFGFWVRANEVAQPIVRKYILDELDEIMHIKDSASGSISINLPAI